MPEKKVNARSTKHQVHFCINCAFSVMISNLIDIIFVLLKTVEELSHWYPGSGVVLDCIDS